MEATLRMRINFILAALACRWSTYGSVMAFNEGILADLRPNFFELLAEEAMHESLRPAVEYVCKVHTHTYTHTHTRRWCYVIRIQLSLFFIQVVSHARPDRFGVLWRLRDELYLFLETALQWRFLRACGE